MVDLSVVIVSWNVCSLLRRCLHSILNPRSPTCNLQSPISNLEVIIVDNASTDGSVEMVRAEFPSVHLIANADNRGFPAANNQGLAVAQGRHIFLLNSDTEVVGDALTTMVAFADAHPEDPRRPIAK